MTTGILSRSRSVRVWYALPIPEAGAAWLANNPPPSDRCRVRHYKCDDLASTCQRCVRAGKQCVRDRGIRFHVDEVGKPAVFPRGQNWVPYPSRVEFVDETELVAREFEWWDDFDLIPPPNRGEETRCIESQITHGDDVSLSEVHTPLLSPSAASPPSASTTTPPASTGFPSKCSVLLAASISLPAHQIAPNQTPWPLSDKQEATLFGHFVTDVSKFFDFCDSDRHFAIEVPQQARQCPTLYNAILALSARHLSQISDFDPYASNHYYQECLKTLIPALSDPDAALDDNLLVATVVLRLLEEFDVPKLGSDAQGHLIGTQLFLQAQAPTPMKKGLRQAAYWAGIRQDIYISLAFQRAPNIKPRTRLLLAEDSPLSEANDCTWTCRAILHCADVLDFAFGTHEESRSLAVYHNLEEYNRQWRDLRPPSFDPYFSQSRANNLFPDLRFHTDWHVMGHQYLELAYILLLVYDPMIPRVGPSYRSTVLLLDGKVRKVTRTLCGTGLSCPSTPSAILVACMAINLCGDRFTEPGEQEELQSILIETERLHGWPTKGIQQSLRNR